MPLNRGVSVAHKLADHALVQFADATKRADRAEAAIDSERERVDALNGRIDNANERADRAVAGAERARAEAEEALQRIDEMSRADRIRKAMGRWSAAPVHAVRRPCCNVSAQCERVSWCKAT